ncbi:3-hydroxyacyl-CoA dehydrogenase NAD-binding domain-containing protein [Oxyplasma meridianum]|uniref:3-hydroxyacyl-CoA dehydrogenase NAD-binding domain-containing protein n=1 Tax=Oxyplasma meridianum TaxID=3073602 RepID=A0AAX4NHH0_9ARCH
MISLEIKKIAVIGSGLMGHGIAEVFALSGFDVRIEDAFPEALEKAKASIGNSIEKLVRSGRIDEENGKSTLTRITYFSQMEPAVKDADFIIEAVPEILELKKEVFSEIDKFARPDAIVASNTSNFKISTLAENMKHPENVVGMHFFNPPVVLKLVEVIMGEKTSKKVFDETFQLSKKIGKTPIKVLKDSPGFVVNRINAPESLFFCLLLDQKVAKPEEVDTFARGQGLPMGPYELMDYVGIDTVVHSLDYYAQELSPEYGKCKSFKTMYESKNLGLKTGKGFYNWKDGHAEIPKVSPSEKLELMDVLAVELNEAVKLIEEKVALPADIEIGVKLGMNRPFGPISVAEGLTNAEVKKKLETLAANYGTSVFQPAESIKNGRLKEIISIKSFDDGKKTSAEHEVSTGSSTGSQDHLVIMEKLPGKVARLSINNTKNNLLSSEVLSDLERNILALWNDHDVNVIIVTGKGPVFSAGAQLSQFFPGSMDFMEHSRKGERIFRLLSEIPKITIAEMKGYTLGGGFELSLACDLRVGTEDVQIGFPEVTLGLVPGWGGTQRLPRLIGTSRASYLILTGTRFSGKEAFDMGIVNRLFPKEHVDEETSKFAEELAQKAAPTAAALAKRLINKGSEVPMDAGLEMESIAMGLLYGTEDLKEGISAFLQKRKPEYPGR